MIPRKRAIKKIEFTCRTSNSMASYIIFLGTEVIKKRITENGIDKYDNTEKLSLYTLTTEDVVKFFSQFLPNVPPQTKEWWVNDGFVFAKLEDYDAFKICVWHAVCEVRKLLGGDKYGL